MVLAQQKFFYASLTSAIALAIVLSGCTPNHYFKASSLPMELAAKPMQSAQSFDLSRYSGPPADSSRIAAGDILSVTLAAGLSSEEIVEFDVRVGAGGETLLPEIGRLPLGGLDAEGAEKMIVAACVNRRLYRHPHVTVAIKEQRKNLITVAGAVKEPGVKELPRGSSYVLAAILAAGGIEENAGTKITIRQPAGPSILAGNTPAAQAANRCTVRPLMQQPDSAVDLAAAGAADAGQSGVYQVGYSEPVSGSGGQGVDLICLNLAEVVDNKSGQTELRDGSIVTVERLTPEPIKVIGLVRKPDQFDYPMTHDVRLLDAIALAGGVSAKQTDKVIVIRKLPDGTGFTGIEASLKKAKQNPTDNLRLAPGDVVSVEQTLGTMVADTINFVRFGIGASVPLF